MPEPPPVMKMVFTREIHDVSFDLLCEWVVVELLSRRRGCGIVGVALRPGGVDGAPIDVGKRRVRNKPIYEIGVGDVGAAKGDKVCEASFDQMVAALLRHVDVGDERTAEDGAEVFEHAVASQLLEGCAGEVGCVSREEQVREAVIVEPVDDVGRWWEGSLRSQRKRWPRAWG